jgi:hypothetical protein
MTPQALRRSRIRSTAMTVAARIADSSSVPHGMTTKLSILSESPLLYCRMSSDRRICGTLRVSKECNRMAQLGNIHAILPVVRKHRQLVQIMKVQGVTIDCRPSIRRPDVAHQYLRALIKVHQAALKDRSVPKPYTQTLSKFWKHNSMQANTDETLKMANN